MGWISQWTRGNRQRSDLLSGTQWELAVIGNDTGANQVRFQYGSPRVVVNKIMADSLPWDEARVRAVGMMSAYIRNARVQFSDIERELNGTAGMGTPAASNPAHARQSSDTAGGVDGHGQNVHDHVGD